MQTIRTLALALAALATLASCESAPPLAPPDEPAFTTGAAFPAPAGFTVQEPIISSPNFQTVVMTWEDVPGDYGYLVQWRKGETGTWKTLVTTGANRTTFSTDSIANLQPNYYRVAVFTSDFRTGAFSTALLKPSIKTEGASMSSDTTAALTALMRPNGSTVDHWFEWGLDSLMSGAARTPAQTFTPNDVFSLHRVTAAIPVTPGTVYYFRGAVSNAAGTTYGAVQRFDAGAPRPPTGVTAVFSTAPRYINASVSSAAHHVYLTWTHDGNNTRTWRVQRRLVGSANWVQAADFLYYEGKSYIDEGFPVSSDRQYDYRVLACNAVGGCAPSDSVRVSTQGLPAPAGFTATRLADGRVALAWQDLPTNQSFTVQWRAGETGSWQALISTGKDVRSHTTDRVTAGVTNHYRVAGEVKTFRAGAFSEASVAPGAGRGMQLQTGSFTLPSGVSASLGGVVTPNGLPAMAWIEWGTDPSLAGASATTASPVGSGVSAVTFADTVAVSPGQTYYYRAAASNSQGTLRGAIKSFHAGPPSAPGLNAAFDLASYRIVVTPTHNGGGTPTVFRIERRATGQTAWTLAETRNTTTPYTHVFVGFPANAARSYDWRAFACNAAGECTVSPVATVQTQPLAAPAGLTAVPGANGQVTVSWQDVTGEVAYLLQWRTDPAGPWKTVVSTGANRTSYTSASITPGVTNHYRVAGEASSFRQGLFSEISISVP